MMSCSKQSIRPILNLLTFQFYLEASMSLWMLFLKGFYSASNPPLEQAFNSVDPAHVIWPLSHNTVP